MARVRWRTAHRTGRVPGQPPAPRTDPENIPAARRVSAAHTCAECFRPRIAYGGRLFCQKCLADLFGWPGTQQYDRFLITEKSRQTRLRNRRAKVAR